MIPRSGGWTYVWKTGQADHNRCTLLAREDGVTGFKNIQMIHAGVKNLGCFIQHIAGYREEDCQNLHAGVKLMIRYSLCLSVSFWSEYWLGLVVLLEEEASILLDCSAAILGCHAYNWFWE